MSDDASPTSDGGPLDFPRRRSDADRRIRQADRLSRVLRVLQFIQSRARWTIPAIARELGCSERTIYRDLNVLSFAGVPYYVDPQSQCLRVRPDYKFPVLALSDDELIGQATAKALTSAPGLDVTRGAAPTTEKIAAGDGEAEALLGDVARLTQVLDLKLADHRQHAEIIRAIQWALVKRRRLDGRYRSPYDKRTKTLILHPYRLCLVKSAWYLVARKDGSDEPRTYRVVRFRSLRMTDRPADVPDEFDLRGYFGNAWSVFRGDTSYAVHLRFSRDVADIVTETVWHHTQKVVRCGDGDVALQFDVDGLREIARWVVGWAPHVQVVEPQELRDRVVDAHRRAIDANTR